VFARELRQWQCGKGEPLPGIDAFNTCIPMTKIGSSYSFHPKDMDIPGLPIPRNLMDIQSTLDLVFENTLMMCLIKQMIVHLLECGKYSGTGKFIQMVEYSIAGGNIILFCLEVFCSIFDIGIFSNSE